MLRHASDQDLMDVLGGAAEPRQRAHVEECAGCRARLAEARHGLLLAREAGIPEPSPLYWEAFRRQVGRRISDEPPALWRWRLAPALAVLGVLVAVGIVVPRHVPSSGAVEPLTALAPWTALPPAEEDSGLAVLQALATSADDLAPVTGCQEVADCIADLSDEQSRALAEVLRREMRGRHL